MKQWYTTTAGQQAYERLCGSISLSSSATGQAQGAGPEAAWNQTSDEANSIRRARATEKRFAVVYRSVSALFARARAARTSRVSCAVQTNSAVKGVEDLRR